MTDRKLDILRHLRQRHGTLTTHSSKLNKVTSELFKDALGKCGYTTDMIEQHMDVLQDILHTNDSEDEDHCMNGRIQSTDSDHAANLDERNIKRSYCSAVVFVQWNNR